MENMKPCPFCGGTKLKLDKKSALFGHTGINVRVERHTYSVRCNRCFARGGAVGGKVAPYERDSSRLPSDVTTSDVLKQKAIDLWNTRSGDEIDFLEPH